jgi:hypothetical protein
MNSVCYSAATIGLKLWQKCAALGALWCAEAHVEGTRPAVTKWHALNFIFRARPKVCPALRLRSIDHREW